MSQPSLSWSFLPSLYLKLSKYAFIGICKGIIILNQSSYIIANVSLSNTNVLQTVAITNNKQVINRMNKEISLQQVDHKNHYTALPGHIQSYDWYILYKYRLFQDSPNLRILIL